jgi:uncharacterized protein YjbI with pentapeptide repeats
MMYQKISPEQLKAIFEKHQKWLESGGKEGQRADLSDTDLRKVNLLRGKNLSKAVFQGADLSEANLTGAILFEASFTNAKLCNADLKDTVGLLPKQLAGANLSNANLPESISKFDELANIEKMSRNSRRLLLWIILGCIYSWLTIGTTSDLQLLTDSASSPLPIIRTEISIVWFYKIAPFIIFGVCFYFHIYLQRLWEQLADLPAVFPDGTPLYRKVYPWLLNCLGQMRLLHLEGKHPSLYSVQLLLSFFLVWCVVPLTLFFFWLTSLRRHDLGLTLLLTAILTLSIVTAILSCRIHSKTIRREVMEPFLYSKALRDVRTYKTGAVVLLIGIIFCFLSLGAIYGVRPCRIQKSKQRRYYEYLNISNLETSGVRTWVPRLFEFFGYIPFADIEEVDASTKPANWTGQNEKELYLVKGARLKGRDMRYAKAPNVFLINADLRSANLHGANLSGADLRGATLQNANVSKANLFKANLQKVYLEKADLSSAYLRKADLKGAFIRQTNLSGSSFAYADLSTADLYEADLRESDLNNAELRNVNLQGACLAKAHFNESNLQGANLHNAILEETNFQGSNLSNVNLRNAIIQNTDFFETIFQETDLRGVNLITAINLTKKQIESAIIDNETQLPTYLKKPEQSREKR